MLIPTSFGGIRPWCSQDADAPVKYANNRKVWLNLRDGKDEMSELKRLLLVLPATYRGRAQK
jgi:hypothetical protein